MLLSNYIHKKLELVQPKFLKEYYELISESEVLGSVQLKGFIKHRAFFKSSFGNWEIYHTGFLKTVFEVRIINNELPFARYLKNTWKSEGVVELPRGEKLKLKHSILKDTVEIQNITGLVLVRLKKKFSLTDKIEIRIEQKSEIVDRHPWIIIMAWYLMKELRSHA